MTATTFAKRAVMAALLLGLGAGLASCASLLATPIGSKVVDRSFKMIVVRWRGRNELTVVAVNAFEREGRSALCSASGYVGDFSELSIISETDVGGATLYYGDMRIIHGLRSPARYNEVEQVYGKLANCVMADAASDPAFETLQPDLRYAGAVGYTDAGPSTGDPVVESASATAVTPAAGPPG